MNLHYVPNNYSLEWTNSNNCTTLSGLVYYRWHFYGCVSRQCKKMPLIGNTNLHWKPSDFSAKYGKSRCIGPSLFPTTTAQIMWKSLEPN